MYLFPLLWLNSVSICQGRQPTLGRRIRYNLMWNFSFISACWQEPYSHCLFCLPSVRFWMNFGISRFQLQLEPTPASLAFSSKRALKATVQSAHVHKPVVGGTSVSQGTYAYAVKVTDVSNFQEIRPCADSIIDPEWFLRAAHCCGNVTQNNRFVFKLETPM